MRKHTTCKLLITALLLLTLCIACAVLSACDQTPDTPEETIQDPNATQKETDMTQPVTEPITEPETELFQPDPDRAVPEYDALMSDLDAFPLTFKYDGTDYAGFGGFSLESET
jgi:hypothetical protein